MLSPNEDVGPEFRNTHRKLLQQQQQTPQTPTSPILPYFNGGVPSRLPGTQGHLPHLLNEPVAPGQQYLIPPPPHLGFSGSSSCASVTSEGSYSTTTTTTGCLIAEATADIDHIAEQVVTPSTGTASEMSTGSSRSGSTNSGSVTCESDQVSVIRHPSYFTKMAGAQMGNTRDSGRSSVANSGNGIGQLFCSEGDMKIDEDETANVGFKEHKQHRVAKKGTILLNVLNDSSSDQVSLDDVMVLDLSPNGDSDISRTTAGARKKKKSKTPINSKSYEERERERESKVRYN